MIKRINNNMRRIMMAAFAALLLSGSALTLVNANEGKVLVDHKGSLICVDQSSVDGHVGHGDTTDLLPCVE